MVMKELMMSELARSPEQLGNAIRRVRKKRGMSQSELGEKAGLRQETISLIENGNPAAKFETILAVLSALDLEIMIHERSKRTDFVSSLQKKLMEHGKK
jgi:HTH-type transcriptional regulator/antitoxin HipB